MKKLLIWNPIWAVLLLSCNSTTSEHKQHAHKDANAHMHETPFEELVKRFESTQRDSYQQPQKVIDYIGDLKNKSIIDIGAGTGYFSKKFAEAGANVIAADVDQRFLDYMVERFHKIPALKSNIEIRKIPFENPGLKTSEVDMAFMVNVYHHIENRTAYFNNLKSGLKSGGKLIIIDFFKRKMNVGPPPEHKVEEDVVKKEIQAAGFKIKDYNDQLLPNQYILIAVPE